MDKRERVLQKIIAEGIVGIIRTDKAENLLEAVGALDKGGLKVIEVTMTTPGAADLIKKVSSQMAGKVIFGAGTVLDTETCRRAIDSGARFIVSPVFNPDIIKLCHRNDTVSMPGAFTPTEILAAWETGGDLIKVFPASCGGPGHIKSIHNVLPRVRLVPVGGINANNLKDYFKAGAMAVAVGGELVDKKTIAEGRFDELTRKAGEYCSLVEEARRPKL